MPEKTQYGTEGSSSDVLERLDRLEAAVNRVLRLQRLDIDDFTIGGLAKSQESTCCSTISTGGCDITSNGPALATPRNPAG